MDGNGLYTRLQHKFGRIPPPHTSKGRVGGGGMPRGSLGNRPVRVQFGLTTTEMAKNHSLIAVEELLIKTCCAIIA